MEDKLGRTFQAAEELIFGDANPQGTTAQLAAKDKEKAIHHDTSKKMYKHLLQLHKTFEQIVQDVAETGKCLNAVRSLEQQIDHMSQRNDSINIEQLSSDMQQVKQEN